MFVRRTNCYLVFYVSYVIGYVKNVFLREGREKEPCECNKVQLSVGTSANHVGPESINSYPYSGLSEKYTCALRKVTSGGTTFNTCDLIHY